MNRKMLYIMIVILIGVGLFLSRGYVFCQEDENSEEEEQDQAIEPTEGEEASPFEPQKPEDNKNVKAEEIRLILSDPLPVFLPKP